MFSAWDRASEFAFPSGLWVVLAQGPYFAHVGHDHDVDQILVKVVVDFLGVLDELIHLRAHVVARFEKTFLNLGKQAHAFSLLYTASASFTLIIFETPFSSIAT